jgi:hypothetical protein
VGFICGESAIGDIPGRQTENREGSGLSGALAKNEAGLVGMGTRRWSALRCGRMASTTSGTGSVHGEVFFRAGGWK